MKTTIKSLSIFTLVVFLVSPKIFAATYYVANSGDDANAGTNQAAPIKSLSQAVANLHAGDTVLFNRGDTFRGSFTISNDKDASIGAYGSGDKPILKGSTQVTNWSLTTHPDLDSSKVYEADVSFCDDITNSGIFHLFVNDEIMTIARFPNVDFPTNENWMNIDEHGKNTFIDTDLIPYNSTDDYWKDATIRWRSYSWENKATTVVGYNGTTGKVDTKNPPDMNFGNNWGYFFDNKLQELDYPGEWIYDPNSKKVYLYPKNSINPNTALVEGITESTGIKITFKSHNVVVQDLDIRHYKETGISTGLSNIVVRNCSISYCKVGFSTWMAYNFLFENNFINYAFENGMNIRKDSYGDVVGNKIMNTAVLRIYSTTQGTSWGDGIKNDKAIQLNIRSNWIENTCYCAIENSSHNTVIENNYIKNAQCVLNDGGALNLRSSTNVLIKNNFIFDSYGDVGPSNGDAFNTGWSHRSYSIGIFCESPSGTKIVGNTIARCRDRGILSGKMKNAVYTNNTFYSNRRAIELKDADNIVIKNNIMFTAKRFDCNINQTHNGISWGSKDTIDIDDNIYCNPYSGLIGSKESGNHTLDFWKARFPTLDQNSVSPDFKFDKYSIVSVDSDNILTNGTFDADDSGWGSGVDFDPAKLEMDGGSAKVDYSGGKHNVACSKHFSLESNKWYHVQFDAIASPGAFFDAKFFISADPPGVDKMDRNEYFTICDEKKTFHGFFRAVIPVPDGRFFMNAGKWVSPGETNFWLDNIVLEEVTVSKRNRQQIIIETAYAPSASADSVLLANPYFENKTYDLLDGLYSDLFGAPANSVLLKPYESKILVRTDGIPEPTVFLIFNLLIFYCHRKLIFAF